jgi:NAD kinase
VTLAANPATVVTDGYLTWEAQPGDTLAVGAYRRRLKVVRFRPPDEFFAVLRSKVGWGTPLVPRP